MNNKSDNAGCLSETGTLSQVIACRPEYFRITSPINKLQEKHQKDNPPIWEIAITQYHKMVEVLRGAGVTVDFVEPAESLPYQVFTRDTGCVIGQQFLVSNLKKDVRKAEIERVLSVIGRYGLDIITPDEGYIEGGDILLDNHTLLVGIGSRTDSKAVDFLRRHFGHRFEIVPLPFKEEYLHLDTVFNIIGGGNALIFRSAFGEKSLSELAKKYNLLEVTPEEQERMAVNILSLAPGKVMAIKENAEFNSRLRQMGLEVIEVEFSELIKAGGSVRCATLPLERKEQ